MQYGTLNTDLGPEPPPLVYPINMPRDVPGCGTTIGHFMRNPNTDWHRRKRESQIKQRAAALESQAEEIKLQQKELFREEYFKKSDPKMLRSKVETLARVGMKAVERHLKTRQEALRQQLINDELRWECLEKEIAARQISDRLAEVRRYTQKVHEEQEAKRLQMVEVKREQQDREGNDILRTAEATKNLFNCKEVNLCQMRDKRDRAEADREVERFYNELNQKLVETRASREEQDARKRLARNVEQMNSIRAQIAYQQHQNHTSRINQLCLEAERVRMLQEKEGKEDGKEWEQKQKERERLRADFERQITVRRKALAEEAERNAAAEEKISRENRAILAKEDQSGIEAKKSANVEMKMYLNHVRSIKEEQAQQERETEELIEENRKAMQKIIDERRCQESEARRKLIGKTLEERANQIKLQEERRKWEEEVKKQEQEEAERFRKCQQALRAEYEVRLLEEKKKYAEDLHNQLRFQCILKQREDEEKQWFLKRCEEEEEKYQKRVEELLNKPMTGSIHPFRRKIEETSERCHKHF